MLQFLANRDLRITFFVVGQDAALERNRVALSMLSDAGHEIACHSFSHEPWLHLYSEEQLDEELEKAENAIQNITGEKVNGFRGPGFSISELTIKVLHERGYMYDATVFPNILNPLARTYFFARSNLTKEEKMQRKGLFGTFSDAFRPVKPFRWDLKGSELVELPVTTMPIFKTPIHFSYLIYLSGYSEVLAMAYLRFATFMCRVTRTEPSLLLHPLDFLGYEDDSDLAFFPAMDMGVEKKLRLMDRFFQLLLERFEPTTVGDHVAAIKEAGQLRGRRPHFSI